MTLANPLSVAAFADLLGIEDVRFTPMWAQKRSLSGGGETIYADRAPMLLRADVTSGPMTLPDAEAKMALLNSRAGGLKTALMFNPRLPYPSSDPTGAIFGAATPLVGTITDRLHAAFTGFPALYQIPAGTFLSVLFDTSRYYLGQFAEARTASGGGAIASVELTPALPDGVASGNAVTVIKPPGKFRIVPASAYLSQVGPTLARLTFSAEQTYSA